MSNPVNTPTPYQAALLLQADKLEAALTIMHGTAYSPSLMAMRLIRRLGQETPEKPVGVLDPTALAELIATLRRLSSTVAKPASTSMTDAAETLEAYQRNTVS